MKRYFFIGLLPAFLLLSSGCTKLIEVDRPSNTVGNDVIFKTDERANTALMAIYAQMINFNGSLSLSNGALPVLTGLMTDEYSNQTMSSDAIATVLDEFERNNVTRDNMLADDGFWKNGYAVIFSCNAVIEGVAASTSSGLTNNTRNLLTGEAKLVRAFQHFYLAGLYGAVPVVLTTNINQTRTLGRTPVADVYTQVEADLKAAFELLPADYSAANNTRYRPNKWVAAALLARLYLYEKKYQAAAEQATLVINSGVYKLLPPEQVFMINSEESLWQLEYSTRGKPVMKEAEYFTPAMQYNVVPDDFKLFFLTPELFEMIVSSGQAIPRCPMTPALIGAFEGGDLRKAKWTDTVPVPAAPPYNGAGFRFSHKYENVDVFTNEGAPVAYTVIRLAEMYLIRAEALARQGTDLATAAKDINTIRTRAGLPDIAGSGEQLLAAVIRERRVELFGEWGHRWFDLQRLGKAAEVLGQMTVKQPWTNDHLLLPLPQAELTYNPILKQNPGYN